MNPFLIDNVKSALNPPPIPPPSVWLEQNLQLKGIYESKRTEGESFVKLTSIQKYILDAANESDVREITLMTSAQGIGKTFIARLLLAYWIATRGGNAGCFNVTQTAAKNWSKEKWVDLFLSPALAELKTPNVDDFGILSQRLINSSVKHLACNPRDLASATLEYGLADELDKIQQDSEAEGDLLGLLMQRFKKFERTYKFIKTSTPRVITKHEETSSKIWQSYLEGDQRNLYVYSPYDLERAHPKKLETKDIVCDESAKLEGGGYDEAKVMQTAGIKCWITGNILNEAQRAAMVNNGVWIKENANPRYGCISFHSNDIYNLDMPMGTYLLKFLNSKHSYSKIKTFTQSHEGKPFDETYNFEKSSMMQNGFCGDYEAGDIKRWVNLPKIAIVDVQKNVYKCLIFAVNIKKVHVVDYLICETPEEMEEFILYRWNCFAAGIDSGYHTREVKRWVLRNRSNNWVALDGQQNPSFDSFGKVSLEDMNYGISKYKSYITNIAVNNALCKDEMDFIRRGGANEYWRFFKLNDSNGLIEKEIFGEYKANRRNTKSGKMAQVWQETGSAHDFWDISVYFLAVHEHFLPKMRTYSPIERVKPDSPPVIESVEVEIIPEAQKQFNPDELEFNNGDLDKILEDLNCK